MTVPREAASQIRKTVEAEKLGPMTTDDRERVHDAILRESVRQVRRRKARDRERESVILRARPHPDLASVFAAPIWAVVWILTGGKFGRWPFRWETRETNPATESCCENRDEKGAMGLDLRDDGGNRFHHGPPVAAWIVGGWFLGIGCIVVKTSLVNGAFLLASGLFLFGVGYWDLRKYQRDLSHWVRHGWRGRPATESPSRSGGGYQPTRGSTDRSNPPQGGSGVSP